MAGPTSDGLEGELAARLLALIDEQPPSSRIAVWGASASGARVRAALLASHPQRPVVLVDSNPARQRDGLDGQPVQDPATLAGNAEVIVIASTSPEATADIRATAARLCPDATVLALVELMPATGLSPRTVHVALDRPRDDEPVQRTVALQGWAAAGSGIDRVEAAIGGRRWRLAYGLPRPDVASTLASTPGASSSGVADAVDVSWLPPGPHDLSVVAYGRNGATATVTRRIVRRDGPSLPHPPCAFCGATSPVPSSRIVNDFTVVGCRHCEGASVVPSPTPEACRDWYNDPGVYAMIARARRQAQESPTHPDAAILGPLLRHRLGAGRPRLLEIGCANGRLLNGLREQGFEVTGLEISQETSEVARQAFGLDVRTGLLEEHRFEAPFDAIIGRHMIEHVPDPAAELRRMHALLRPGGVVLLVTPNFASLASSLLRERWEWFIPPLHVHYFTPRAMTQLATRSGFDVTYLGTRRGDARVLRDELARWASPLASRGERTRAMTFRLLSLLTARLGRGGLALSTGLWQEELVALLEAR